MISILDRYVGQAILKTGLLVLLLLVALAGIFALISELNDVGKGNYSVFTAMQYVLLTIPSKAYLLFAPAVLLGSLLGLGGLATNSELTVMRAAGISNARIIRAVLMTGFLLALFIAIIGETVMPKAELLAEELRLTALEKRLSVKGRNGLWIKSSGRYVNISTVMPDFTLLDLHIHEFDGVDIKSSLSASSAVMFNEGGVKDDWLFKNVSLSQFSDEQIDVQQFEERLWSEIAVSESGVVPNLLSVDVLKSMKGSNETLSATNLYDQLQYLKANQLDHKEVELAFWGKVVSPLASIVMLMLSLPFVFTSQRSGGAGQKLFIGIMLGIVYVLVSKLLTQLALTNGFSPVVSATLPLLFFLFVALIGIQKTA